MTSSLLLLISALLQCTDIESTMPLDRGLIVLNQLNRSNNQTVDNVNSQFHWLNHPFR